jgi:hypothetical protein
MLLELDKEEGKRPGADAWRNTNSGTPDGKPAQNLRLNAEKTDPNEPRQTPADVASELLKGKGSLLKRKW